MRICPACKQTTEQALCPRDGTETLLCVRDPLLGSEVGRFRLEERLGSGAFGVVYRASHRETGGQVAVKLLRAELTADPAALKRFEAEARHTHRLHHPNTVRLVDFGATDDGRVYLATEFVNGRSLRLALEQEGRFAPARAARIARQVAKSLGEAHSAGIVHRDLKPENVMLVDQFGEPDFVKVLDFGIARSVQSAGNSTQGPVGTPRYMAPEQWLGMPVDARADIYALGVMLYEMLTGAMPFGAGQSISGDAAMFWMNAHVHEQPTPLLAALNPAAVQPELELLATLVDQMLAKSPRSRLRDATEFLLLLDGQSLAPPVQLSSPSGATGSALEDTWPPGSGVYAPSSASAQAQEGLAPSPRRAAVNRGAAAAVLALAAGAAGWTWYSAEPTSQATTRASAAAERAQGQGEGAAVSRGPGASAASEPPKLPVMQLPLATSRPAEVLASVAPRREPASPEGAAASAPAPGPPSAAPDSVAVAVRSAQITTNPEGATVRVVELDTALEGVTPLAILWPPAVQQRLDAGAEVTLEFVRPGRKSVRRKVMARDKQERGWVVQAELPAARTARAPTGGAPGERPLRALPALRLPSDQGD